MELWIRSQNRKNLINGNYLEYGEWNKEHRIYIQGEVFGKYKTKERALEVLDEIQSKLKQQFIVKPDMSFSQKVIDQEEIRLNYKYNKKFIMEDSGFEILPINSNVVIYEMPKE